MNADENNPNEEFGITSSPVRLNRSDSILDIHTTVDFEETDLPESESETVNMKSSATEDSFVLPEPSKWEREDDTVAEKCKYISLNSNKGFFFIFLFSLHISIALVDTLPTDDQAKVTNEVLKRAENAIFARAINAIRPIEIKKICPERQKLYSNEVTGEHDKSPLSTPSAHVEKPSDDVLQITVLNTEQERSVEIKSGRQQRTKTPPRSIKERLGKKLNDDVKSRSRTPQRKSADNRNDRAKSRSKERRSREQDKRRDNRDRKYRSPANDNRRNLDGRRNENPKSSDKTYRDKDRRRNSSESRDTKDSKKSLRDRDEKDTAPVFGREEHKVQVEKATRDTERDRELQKARVRARIREEERAKAQLGN